MDALLTSSALEQAAAVRAGEVSAVELAQAALNAAEREQPRTGAFAELDGERALATAADIGRDDPRPFAGVPYAVKDLAVACAGLRLTCGSRAFAEFRPDHDSHPVRRAKEAGLVVLGSTVSAEFGLLPVSDNERFGPVRNPVDAERSAGGSSGGAGAAVGGGVLAIAAASDAGGSIRIPAACCGLVGLKPARGRVSLGPELGDHPLATELVVTRTVADTAAMLDVLAGPEPGDATWAPPPAQPFARALDGEPGPMRLAVCTASPFGDEADAERRSAVDVAARRLGELGHHVEEVALPWSLEPVLEAFTAVWSVGAAAFAGFAQMVGGGALPEQPFGATTAPFVERGLALPAAAFAGAMTQLQGWARAMVLAQDGYDAVICPALATAPPSVGAFDGLTSIDAILDRALRFTPFTPMANVTGQPAIVVPAGRDADGLPIAVQLIGRPLGEAALLALAAQLEADADDVDAAVRS